MTEKAEPILFTFERGLNTVDPASVLDEGMCQQLDNFEWLPNGGITPRAGWKRAGATPSQPTDKKGRGLFTGWYESGIRKLVGAAANAATDTYDLIKTDVADPTLYTTSTEFDQNIAITAGFRNDPVRFAIGASVLVSTQPGYPSQQLRKYTGSVASAIAVSNIAGRCIIYHLSRFFVGGNPTNPTYLRYSEPGDPDTWNVEDNFLPVGQDDGEPIEDMVIFDRGLVIGKQHSLWFLSGNDEDNFRVDQLTEGIGVARGRSMVTTRHGVFFIAADGSVWLYDGADSRQVSKDVRLPTPAALGSGYASIEHIADKLFVRTNSGQTIYVLDTANPRWRVETHSSATGCPKDLAGFDGVYLIATGTDDGTIFLRVRQEVGPYVANTGYRDPKADQNFNTPYAAKSAEIWPKGAFGKAVLKEVWIRYRQWTDTTGEPLRVSVFVDGVEVAEKTLGPKTSAGVYTGVVSFNTGDAAARSGKNFALKLHFTPEGAENDTYSIEECWAMVLADQDRRAS